MKHPNIRHLEFLVALHEHGTFGRAARACRVSQPTLSHGVRRLEEVLGMQLVLRTHRDLAFTDAGQAVLDYARRILADAEQLQLLADRDPFSDQVVVGGIPTLLPAIIGPWLAALKVEFPELCVKIVEDTSSNLARSLITGEVEFVLAATPYDSFTPDLFEIRSLWDDPFYRVSAPSRTVEEGVLLLERTHCLSGHALAACQTPDDVEVHFQSSSIIGLIEMIANGLGISYLPETVVAYLRETRRDLKWLKVEEMPDGANRRISAIWRKDTFRSELFVALSQSVVNARN